MLNGIPKLFFVVSFALLYPLLATSVDRQFIGCPGKNYTVYKGQNIKIDVCVEMRNYMTGEPAIASFWSTDILKKNKDLGKKKGEVCFKIQGLRPKLRVGHIQSPTVFYVNTGNKSVYFDFTIKLKDFSSYGMTNSLNPCIPMCKQVGPPKRTLPPECRWTCNTAARGGNWQVWCSSMKLGPRLQ